MGKNSRQEQIVRLISTLREVSVQSLTKRFEVSEATVRKDLTLLEEMGYLVRTHGGAILAEDRSSEFPLSARMSRALAEKRRIVRKARQLIREGDTVFLDSGSTCALLAHEIQEMTLRVVCHSLGVCEALKNASAISLFSLGGSYRKDAESFIGPIAVDNLRRFQIETCFIGAAAFSADGIFSAQNIIEAELKREVLKCSRRRFILADHTKFESAGFSVFARPGDFDTLITDSEFEAIDRLTKLGIDVLLAEE